MTLILLPSSGDGRNPSDHCPNIGNHNTSLCCAREIEIEQSGTDCVFLQTVPVKNVIMAVNKWTEFCFQVTKTDVDAALKVLNFAIYHQELTEMEDRENEREMEAERDNTQNRAQRRRSSRNTEDDNGDPATDAGKEGPAVDAMDVDDPPTEPTSTELSKERIDAFNAAFLQCMRYQQSISIDALETTVNTGSTQYTRPEIMVLLQKLQDDNRVMIAEADGKVHLV
ncbi:DNA replication licensing factor MCM3 [Linum grandiflorum]